MLSLLTTAEPNDIDSRAWLADVLARIADIPQNLTTNCSPGIGGVPLSCPSGLAVLPAREEAEMLS